MKRYDTETTCHCGGDYRGSDHCPECACEQYESGDCGHTHSSCGQPYATSYPYSAGDDVMVGISTWQSPQRTGTARALMDSLYARHASLEDCAALEQLQGPVHGPSGPLTRYFKRAKVVANDREAGVLVVRYPDGNLAYDELLFSEFDGSEVVPYASYLPTTAKAAWALALIGYIH